MNQDNNAIENQEEKQETFLSTMKYLFVQVPKELLNIGYPKSSPPPNEEIKRKCLGAAAGMVCTEAEIKETENTDDDSAQEVPKETFWSTMKFLFVQVPKELLGIGYPKSSPPPNEEIKRKCLGAAAGMACTEIKKWRKASRK